MIDLSTHFNFAAKCWLWFGTITRRNEIFAVKSIWNCMINALKFLYSANKIQQEPILFFLGVVNGPPAPKFQLADIIFHTCVCIQVQCVHIEIKYLLNGNMKHSMNGFLFFSYQKLLENWNILILDSCTKFNSI